MPNIKMFGSPTRLGNGQLCLVVIGCQVPQSRGSSTRRYLGFERWNAVDMAKLWRSFCGVLLYICIQCVWSLGIWEFFLEVGSSQLTGRRFAQFLGQIQAEYGQYAQCERFMLSSAESGKGRKRGSGQVHRNPRAWYGREAGNPGRDRMDQGHHTAHLCQMTTSSGLLSQIQLKTIESLWGLHILMVHSMFNQYITGPPWKPAEATLANL